MAYDRTKAVSYALDHALSYSGDYRRYDNDCTNFVSQCMFAGGWKNVTGFYTLDSVWWYTGGIFGVRASSYTWAGAQNFHDFAVSSKRVEEVSSLSSLTLGDVIQLKNAKGIHHTMIITGVLGGEFLLSYHTNDTLNKKLSDLQAAVGDTDTLVLLKVADS